MSDFHKQAFAQALRGFMRSQREAELYKKAAPEMGMPSQGMDPAMMGGVPPQEEPPAQDAGAQPPQETLNIQAKGPDAIDAIKSMMGSAGMQPTQEDLPPELLAQDGMPPEAMMQGGMPPKMASLRDIRGMIRQAMER